MKKLSNIDYLFWDLDGTLTDSQEGIFKSLRVMLDYFGISKTDEELKPFLGPALWDSLPKYCGFNKEQCEEAVKVFREYFTREGIFINKVYPGIVSLLEKLKASGYHNVLATGKPEDQAHVVMNYFDLAKYFDFVGGSTQDSSRSRKGQVIKYSMENCNLKSGDASRILMIGDRDTDINGAHQNGFKVCAVLYGYGSMEEFEKNGADFVVESVEALGDFLLDD